MTDVHIPADLVEDVVARIAAMGDEEIRALMRRSGPFQPELTGFVVGSTYECSRVARALATIGMLTAYEAFRVGYVKTRKARERLVRAWAEDGELFASELQDEFRSVEAAIQDGPMSSEPPLMEALLDLAFSDDGRSEVSLEEDESWRLFAVLYTVVETLHECAGAPRFDPRQAESRGEPEAVEHHVAVAVGLGWYTREQWQRMRDTAEDPAEDLEDTYEEWLDAAQATEAELAREGVASERVMIDVDEMLRWFAETGRRATGASRAIYAARLRRTLTAERQSGRGDIQVAVSNGAADSQESSNGATTPIRDRE